MSAMTQQVRELRAALTRLAKLSAQHPKPTARHRPPVSTLFGQPFDSLLLDLSTAFRKSRSVYRKLGGRLLPSFVSTPRTLSSPALLSDEIEYSPVEREYAWTVKQKPSPASNLKLLELRTSVTSLYHEQNHRILWHVLPPAPAGAAYLRRYLNLAESLVIVTDMALADDLGSKLAHDFYLSGTTYDPGSSVREEGVKGRDYRNYLQAAFHATYLNLEFFDPKKIPDAIQAMFPMLGPYARRAALRSANLDRAFIEKTNPAWQARNRRTVLRELGAESARARLHSAARQPLALPKDPLDNRQAYLIGEAWFESAGF